jgi:hypothetical protein
MKREDPFGGAWKLNADKSQFDPNHRPSSATMHWERTPEGYKMTAEGIMGNGAVVQETPATFILDGKDHPMLDAPGFTAIMSRPAPNAIEVESRNVGGIIGKASYFVSGDGTTLTARVSGIDGQQRHFQTVLVWGSSMRPLRSGGQIENRRAICFSAKGVGFDRSEFFVR